jgi:hypothetical protein
MPSREVNLRVFGQFWLLFGIFSGTEGLVYTSCKITPITCNFFAGFHLFPRLRSGIFYLFFVKNGRCFYCDILSPHLNIQNRDGDIVTNTD